MKSLKMIAATAGVVMAVAGATTAANADCCYSAPVVDCCTPVVYSAPVQYQAVQSLSYYSVASVQYRPVVRYQAVRVVRQVPMVSTSYVPYGTYQPSYVHSHGCCR